MKKTFKTIILSLCLLLPAYSWADSDSYSFDTVTEINLHHYMSSISGIEKDTGNPLTVSFRYHDNNGDINNRCVPIFLTAIEKPGRYYLHLAIESWTSKPPLAGCRLEIKS